MKITPDSRIPSISRISDFPHNDTVYVGTVRAPVSSGTIVSISMPHLPRDFRSITADDIPGNNSIEVLGAKVPVLAEGRVSYKGEPVALIVGPDRSKVAEAIALTKVRVNEEKAYFSFEACEASRVVHTARLESGDPDSALRSSTRLVSGEYRMGPQDHYYSEPQGSAAAFAYDKLIVFSSTQWPFHVRDSVARVLEVEKDEVIVRPTLLGSHLDGKLWYPSLLACHASLAAVLCGRPALLLLARPEDFLYTTKRAPILATYTAGLDEQGGLQAIEATIMINAGAYSPFSEEIAQRSVNTALGAYSCQNVRVVARTVRTHLPPMGAFAGLGTGPMNFAIERLAEECAAIMEQDPSEWRGANIAGKGDISLGPPLKRSVPYKLLTERLLVMSDYPRKRSSFELIRKRRADPSTAPGYGIGLAFGPQLSGSNIRRFDMGIPSVRVTLAKDSTLTIMTSLTPGSRDSAFIWKQLAADTLGIQPDMVSIASPYSDTVPDSGPGSLSRNISVVTSLIESACKTLASRRFREALPISVKKSQRVRSSKASPESPLEDAAWGAAVVELELDQVDGRPIVRGVWITVKAGRIVSQKAAKRTLEHDTSVALGLSLGECLDLSKGPADADALRKYRLPRMKDSPLIRVEFIEDENPPRGIGELAYALVMPAFANALSQAMDAPWNSLPLGYAQSGQGEQT